METVEMDLMQAQIGSLATDVSRLEAKVAKGGGGRGVGIITTVVSTNDDQYLYECTNPGALQYVLTNNDDSLSPLVYDNIQEAEFDFTSDMNVITFNADGSTVPYVGHKHIISIVAPRIYYNEGFQEITFATLFEGNITLDMDTGKAVYIQPD